MAFMINICCAAPSSCRVVVVRVATAARIRSSFAAPKKTTTKTETTKTTLCATSSLSHKLHIRRLKQSVLWQKCSKPNEAHNYKTKSKAKSTQPSDSEHMQTYINSPPVQLVILFLWSITIQHNLGLLLEVEHILLYFK